jgi:hypothetical protein
VVLFKLLSIGHLFVIAGTGNQCVRCSATRLYRWYVGLKLNKVPLALTLSQNRRRRFRDSDVYHKLFD